MLIPAGDSDDSIDPERELPYHVTYDTAVIRQREEEKKKKKEKKKNNDKKKQQQKKGKDHVSRRK